MKKQKKTIKKQATQITLFFSACVISSILFVGIFKTEMEQQALKEADLKCSKLALDLEEFNKTCNCWYEPCATGEEYVDVRTQPFCICECDENGMLVKLCLRQAT